MTTRYRSVRRPIVRIRRAYKEREGSLYVPHRAEWLHNTIRCGECLDDFCGFERGVKLYTRHDAVRHYYTLDTREEVEALNFEGVYALDEVCAEEVDGEFRALSPFLWVAPILNPARRTKSCSLDENPDMYQDGEEECIGIVRYSNDDLRALGVVEGDKVIFTKNSEYRYDLFGEKLYRMRTEWIVAKVED